MPNGPTPGPIRKAPPRKQGAVSGEVIVTVTLNAALQVAYIAGDQAAEGVIPVSRPGYRAGGRGVTVARVLRAFGHDVLAAGLAGGVSGELIRADLAKSGVPTAFTLIRGESRRFFRFAGRDLDGPVLRSGVPAPYITTEELGRFAADYRRLMTGAAAVVLCGSLPDGLPADTYGSLVTYAVEAGVPVILDAGGEELKHAVSHGPDLVVAESGSTEPGFAAALVRLGAGAAAVAGLVPGQLLGWSWPDRLRHALALAAGGAGAWTRTPGGQGDREHVDLAAYERLLDAVRVEPPAR